MDNFKFAVERSYEHMKNEIESVLCDCIYSTNERQRLFYACGTCMHWILDLAERIEFSEEDKKLISAYRFANNALKHDKNLFELTKQTGGVSFPIAFPFCCEKKEIRWRKIDNNGKYEKQYLSYVKCLQDKPVLSTCETVIKTIMKYIEEK